MRSAVGAEGRVVGVDLTDAMLARAGDRITRAGWRNVDLVRADAADYPFPACVGGVLSTLAITMVPEHDDVIRRAAAALRPGGRLSLFELKLPEGWPDWLIQLGVALNKPWGLELGLRRTASVGVGLPAPGEGFPSPSSTSARHTSRSAESPGHPPASGGGLHTSGS